MSQEKTCEVWLGAGKPCSSTWANTCGGDHPYLNILTRGDPRRPAATILTAEDRDAQRDLYNNYPIAPGCPQCHYARCGPTVHEWPTEAVCAAFFNAGASCTTTYRESCDNDSPYGAQYNNVPLLALGCEECRDELCDVNWSDYPTPGEANPGAEVLCNAGFNAGATCYTKYSDNCEGDNPAGAEYNDTPMWESGCSQCAEAAVAAAIEAAIADAAGDDFGHDHGSDSDDVDLCDLTRYFVDDGAELACSDWLGAGYTCESTWPEVCGGDHPFGALFNDSPLSESGCSQCDDVDLCDLTRYSGDDAAELACADWLGAGYTCGTTWQEVCDGDHPAGAMYNGIDLSGCPQCDDVDLCDLTRYSGDDGAELACAEWLGAGHTCDSTWPEVCGGDHPAGDLYNDIPVGWNDCPQCSDYCPITRKRCEIIEDLGGDLGGYPAANCNCGDCGFPACGDCDCDYYGEHCCTGNEDHDH